MTRIRAPTCYVVRLRVRVGRCGGRKITVFAAASLTMLCRMSTPPLRSAPARRSWNFSVPSTLARQIEAGAPAQVFISADAKWMDYLAQKNLIATQAVLLGNALALIAPADAAVPPQSIDSGFNWAKLLGPNGRLATGDPDHVPAGIYAKDALQHLGAWKSLEPRLARADDVAR